MNTNTETMQSVGTKIPSTTALQLRSVLEHYRQKFNARLVYWIERDYKRINKGAN